MLVTDARIILMRPTKMRVQWEVPLGDLQTIALEPTGISLVLRRGLQGPFLAISDPSARKYLFKSLDG